MEYNLFYNFLFPNLYNKQNMEQPQFGFDQLTQPESVKMMTQIFWDSVYEGDVLKKGVAQKFISDLYYHLESPSATPITKYHSMLVFKDIVNKNDIKVIGVLATSTQFLQGLQKIVLNVDPKKSISEKGKSYFPNDKNGIGNKYVQLITQTLIYLSRKFAKTSKGQPTKFRKAILKIEQQNVNLPTELKYYNLGRLSKQVNSKDKIEKKKEQTEQQQRANEKTRGNQEPAAEKNKQRQPTANFEGIIQFAKFKIKDYMANLQQSDDVQQMQETIIKTHEILKGQLKKFDEVGQTIFETYANKPSVIEQYLNVRGFLEADQQLYQKEISKNQFAAYYNAIKIKYQQLFPQEKQTPGQGKLQSKLSKEQDRKQIKKTDSVTNSNPPNTRVEENKGKYNSKNSRDDQIQKVPPLKSKNSQRVQPVQMSPGKQASDIFNRMQNMARSKSPKAGFKQLRQSLQKQKKNIHARPPNRHKEGKNLAASTLSRDPMASSIFNNVPNSAPPHKSYQGELVIGSKDLESILFDIKKQQGHRRFKVANFRDKYPLFENESMQIGFKTESIFEEYDGFNTFLSMELYLGNKSSRQIRNLEVSFQADENCLIYTSPREISPVIDAETQIKHGLMIIPTKIPFGFINMKLYYQCGSTSNRTTIALPNSLFKLSIHTQLEVSQFHNYWEGVTKIYKTDHFKISKHIPPNSLRKYIPSLRQLTSYSQFSISGSEKDYQLFCLVDVHQDYEGVLRINVRPDLNVVLQMGAIEPSQDGIKYLKYYLQTLQMLLQETNG